MNIEEILAARQKRVSILHNTLVDAREAIRKHLSPDAPAHIRECFDKLQEAIYNLRGDPFSMDIQAALSRSGEGAGDCEGGKLARQFADMYRSGAQGSEMDCDTARFLALSIDELASHSGEGAGVSEARVKPLEWDRESKPGVHFADTRIGTYSAYADGTLQLDGVQLSFVRGRQWSDTENAAQADFDKRIRSALTATQSAPAPGGWREALEHLRALVVLVASETLGEGEDPDDDCVGWDGNGQPLPMTFGHVRRAVRALHTLQATLSASPAPEPVADAVVESFSTSRQWIKEGKEDALAQPAPAAQEAPSGVVEALISKYTNGSIRDAVEERGIPYSILRQHFSEFADELLAVSPTSGAVERWSQLHAWVWEQRLALLAVDPDFHAKYDVLKAVHTRMREISGDAARAERQPQPQEGMPLVNAARELIAARQSTFKARNGRQVGIQDENGEKCWIVPFDEMFALENAVPAAAPLPSQKEGE